MSRKCVLWSLVAVLALGAMAQAANIIWVSDNKGFGNIEPNVPVDQGWVDLLTSLGHNVIYKNQHEYIDGQQYWRTLDPNKIAELEAADLIILSRNADSGSYSTAADNEPNQWNAVTTPLISLSAHMSRIGGKWGWLNGTATTYSMEGKLTVVDPNHPIFAGVDIDPNGQVQAMLTDWNVDYVTGVTDAGNGELLATRASDGLVSIVTWEAGQKFFEAGAVAGGPRMLFVAGAGSKATPVQDGGYNLTTDGEKLFLNAVKFMLNKGTRVVYVTDTIDYDGDGAVDDQSWIDWLKAEGYDVDARRDYWQVLDPNKIGELNAADVVIMSRGVSTGNYNQTGEPAQWNGLTAPLLNLNAWMARGKSSARLKWINNPTDVRKDGGSPLMLVAEPSHPIFAGLPIDANGLVDVLDPNAGSGINSFFENVMDVGNGKLLSSSAGVYTSVWIAEWETGVEYFAGCGQFAGGPRIFFSAGTQDVTLADNTKKAQGVFNLNANGEQLLRNIITYLAFPPAPPVEVALPVENASFELPGTGKQNCWDGGTNDKGTFVDVPGWNSDTLAADSGVESNSSYPATDGVWTGFIKSGDPSVWQVTANLIEAGAVYTLTLDAKDNWAATTLQLSLFYPGAAGRVPVAVASFPVTGTMQAFSLQFTANDAPDAIGMPLGLEITNVSAGDSWIGLDNVRLTVMK